MKFKQYINESKMGKLPSRVERTAYMRDYPEMLEWKLIDPDTADARVNHNMIDSIAWKELSKMKNKGMVNFYDSDFNVGSTHGLGPNKGQISYEATVKLQSYDPKKLMAELRKLKFKVIK
jgi:hypothetical protein